MVTTEISIYKELRRLICAINRERQKAPSLKKYTAIAQARLASEHKAIGLEIETGLKDADLLGVLSKVLDNAERGDQPKSFDALSQEFGTQLRKGVSAMLPTFFQPLRAERSFDERDQVITRSLTYLES